MAESHNFTVTSTMKRIEKSSTITSRQGELYEANKENRVRKDSDSSGSVVKRIKMRYEELSNSRKYVSVRGTQNVSATGAIKKRIIADKPIENREEKTVTSKKRVAIREDEVFPKSRFKVYTDKKPRIFKETIGSVGKKFEGPTDNSVAKEEVRYVDQRPKNRNVTTLQRLTELSAISIQPRFTPIDVPIVPLIPKKVKIQHRQSSKNLAVKPNDQTFCISRSFAYKLPYDDEFINFEIEKEKALFRESRGFRKQNITVEQRKIILKFLIRLNAHAFYPSYFVYQTVRIFDAVLDAKFIEVEDLQLTALAAMWIVLKRDHAISALPSADKMIAFSNDLYAGRKDLLIKCEREILQSLNYEITFPDPFSILCYDITKCYRSIFIDESQVELAYYCGGYMIDLSLFDEDLMNTSAILLAAAAAETALYFVLDEVKSGSEPMWFKWRAPHTSQRYSEDEISRVRSRLIEKISESSQRHTEGEIVFKKYSRSRYGKISHFLGTKVRLFLAPECSINLNA